MAPAPLNRIALFEREPERLRPLSWLRPVWDLRVGGRTIEERLDVLAPGVERKYVGRSALSQWWCASKGGSFDAAVSRSGTLFLEAGAVLTAPAWKTLRAATPPVRLEQAGRLVGAWTTGDGSLAADALMAGELDGATKGDAVLEWSAPVIRSLPDFIANLTTLVVSDLALSDAESAAPGAGVTVIGDHPLRIAPTAMIDPGTTLDVREGAVRIGAGTTVAPYTWIKGPTVIGANNRLLGGTIGPFVATGPTCRVRGEVAETFIQGYTNKAHDGFIGHSVLGEWVNLGAMTTCSDLKNNYSSIRLDTPAGSLDTGLNKLGVFLGDHVKTAIGTLLSTGTIVGTGTNVFGGSGLSPKAIPMFAWGVTGAPGSHALDAFLETTRRTLARRDVAWNAAYEALLRDTHAAAE